MRFILSKAVKNRAHLVPVQKQVIKNGTMFTQTFWVSPEEAKEINDRNAQSGAFDLDHFNKEAADKAKRAETLEYLRKHGIKWEESDHEGINWMRARMAVKKRDEEVTGNASKAVAKKKYDSAKFEKLKGDKQKAIQYLKDSGITWNENSNPNINWMRACMAAKKNTGNNVVVTPQNKTKVPKKEEVEKEKVEKPAETDKPISLREQKIDRALKSMSAEDAQKCQRLGIVGCDPDAAKYLTEFLYREYEKNIKNMLSVAEKEAKKAAENVFKGVVNKIIQNNIKQVTNYMKSNTNTLGRPLEKIIKDWAYPQVDANELHLGVVKWTQDGIIQRINKFGGSNAEEQYNQLFSALNILRNDPNYAGDNIEKLYSAYKTLAEVAFDSIDPEQAFYSLKRSPLSRSFSSEGKAMLARDKALSEAYSIHIKGKVEKAREDFRTKIYGFEKYGIKYDEKAEYFGFSGKDDIVTFISKYLDKEIKEEYEYLRDNYGLEDIANGFLEWEKNNVATLSLISSATDPMINKVTDTNKIIRIRETNHNILNVYAQGSCAEKVGELINKKVPLVINSYHWDPDNPKSHEINKHNAEKIVEVMRASGYNAVIHNGHTLITEKDDYKQLKRMKAYADLRDIKSKFLLFAEKNAELRKQSVISQNKRQLQEAVKVIKDPKYRDLTNNLFYMNRVAKAISSSGFKGTFDWSKIDALTPIQMDKLYAGDQGIYVDLALKTGSMKPTLHRKAKKAGKSADSVVDDLRRQYEANKQVLADFSVDADNTKAVNELLQARDIKCTVSKAKDEDIARIEADFARDWDRRNHRSMNYEIKGVYEVNDLPVEGRYNQIKKRKGNVREFYHGTGSLATTMILGHSGQFRVGKAKVGRMLGDGIYLADKSSKSAQYVHNNTFTRHKAVGTIMVCEASLGETTDQVHGKGDTVEARISKRNWSFLANNEWCVRDPQAVLPKYLIHVSVK